MREAILYQKLNNKKIQCFVCNHFCKINNGERGFCGVRENRNEILYVLTYGLACAENIDPIEKKPLFHFLPGTWTLSVATVGCNFRCDNCQNWEISQKLKVKSMPRVALRGLKPGVEVAGNELPPKQVVRDAVKNDCPSISYTYTEPTVFIEYALDTMKLAREAGLKNIWVSNGYMSPEALELILPYLDAINVDLKSLDDNFYKRRCGARLQPILDNLIKIKKAKVHLEITTLIIPTLSDNSEMLKHLAEFIYNNLGRDTPWHVSAFSSVISWKLQNLPDTLPEIVLRAKEIGLQIGLKYVHAGNI